MGINIFNLRERGMFYFFVGKMFEVFGLEVGELNIVVYGEINISFSFVLKNEIVLF